MDLSRTQGCGPGCGAAEADTAAHRARGCNGGHVEGPSLHPALKSLVVPMV